MLFQAKKYLHISLCTYTIGIRGTSLGLWRVQLNQNLMKAFFLNCTKMEQVHFISVNSNSFLRKDCNLKFFAVYVCVCVQKNPDPFFRCSLPNFDYIMLSFSWNHIQINKYINAYRCMW